MAYLGADLHVVGGDFQLVDDNDLSRDMAASLGFSPSPDGPLRKGKTLQDISYILRKSFVEF